MMLSRIKIHYYYGLKLSENRLKRRSLKKSGRNTGDMTLRVFLSIFKNMIGSNKRIKFEKIVTPFARWSHHFHFTWFTCTTQMTDMGAIFIAPCTIYQYCENWIPLQFSHSLFYTFSLPVCWVVFKILLSILANLKNAAVWIIFTRFLISKSSSTCTSLLVTVPNFMYWLLTELSIRDALV